MFDYQKACEEKIAFYNRPEFVENPQHPAGFRGTFNFSDHRLIPDVYHGFLQRHFGVLRLSRVPLEEINKVMNEIWEGPGSLTKLFQLEEQMRETGRALSITPMDYIKTKKALKSEDEEDEEEVDLPLSVFGSEENEEDAD